MSLTARPRLIVMLHLVNGCRLLRTRYDISCNLKQPHLITHINNTVIFLKLQYLLHPPLHRLMVQKCHQLLIIRPAAPVMLARQVKPMTRLKLVAQGGPRLEQVALVLGTENLQLQESGYF